jgi:hypothetical protein
VILHGWSPSHWQLVGGFRIRIICRPGCPSEHPGQRSFFTSKNFKKPFSRHASPFFFEGIEDELFEQFQSLAKLECLVDFCEIIPPALIGLIKVTHA